MGESTTVYRYIDATGAALYVGVTGTQLGRMRQHAKTQPWWTRAAGCMLEHFDRRQDALLREAELIAMLVPEYNIALDARALREALAQRQAAGHSLGASRGRSSVERSFRWLEPDTRTPKRIETFWRGMGGYHDHCAIVIFPANTDHALPIDLPRWATPERAQRLSDRIAISQRVHAPQELLERMIRGISA